METKERPAAQRLMGGTAVVTGASSGIGRAIALALGAAGVREIGLIGRDAGRLRRVADRLPDGVGQPWAVDLADPAALDGVPLPPRLDVLVHAAGLHEEAPVQDTGLAALDAMLAVNLRAPLLLTRRWLPALRAAQGQVVFVNSTQGLSAGAGVAAYAASKHGLRAVADALRQEVNAHGVRVLSLFLGSTDTPMQARRARAGTADRARLMQPEDVAQAALAALTLGRTAELTELTLRPMRPPAPRPLPEPEQRETILAAIEGWLHRIEWPEPADASSAQERRRLAEVPTAVLAEAFHRVRDGEPWERYLEFVGWLERLGGPSRPSALGKRMPLDLGGVGLEVETAKLYQAVRCPSPKAGAGACIEIRDAAGLAIARLRLPGGA